MATPLSPTRTSSGGGHPHHHHQQHQHNRRFNHHPSSSSHYHHKQRQQQQQQQQQHRVISASQAWSILERHARDDIQPLRLQELCQDNDRVSALVAVHSSSSSATSSKRNRGLTGGDDEVQTEEEGEEESRILVADLSRQLVTLETVNHWFKLADAVDLRRFITRLAWGGQNDPRNPVRPARIIKKGDQLGRKQNQPRNPPPPTPARSTPHRPTPHSHHHQRAASGGSDAPTRFLEREENDGPEEGGGGGGRDRVARFGGDDGQPSDEGCILLRSMHMALRVPPHRGYEMFDRHGENVLVGIHRDWDRIERLATSYRIGQLRGASGSMIRTVLVIGRGVPVEALQFVATALQHDESAVLASRFGMAGNSSISALGEGSSGNSNPAAILATKLRRNLAGMGGVVAASMGGGGGSAASDQHHHLREDPSLHHQHHASPSTVASTARQIKFLSSIDPVAVASVLSALDPRSTLVVSVALSGDEETGLATKLAKAWLLQSLSSASHPHLHRGGRTSTDYVLKHHMVLVTGNDRIASVINKPESVYVVPEHCRCEPFASLTAAMLLPLAIVYGWDIARELLDGAHDLDTHFVTAHARSNIPVLLALSDVWNDAFMGASSRVVTPFAAAFASYPSFVASLEAQACTRPIGTADAPPSCPSLVVDGGTRGAVDRALYQSGQVLSSELVATFDGQVAFNAQMEMQTGNSGGSSNFLDSAIASQDALLCSLFAHADELALGNRTNGDRDSASDVRSVASSPVNLDEVPEDGSDGNRPSLLLLTGKVDAFVCGQLVALAEHRAAVKAHIWGLDPFAARRCGASLRLNRTDQLKESFRAIRQGASDEEDDDGAGGPENRLILSTKTLLRHYSNFTRDLR